MPEFIKKRLAELRVLCEKYPLKIPVAEVAKFLDMNKDGLLAALMRGNAPFGFAYQKDDGGYRVPIIPTTKFYLWYANMNGQMVMSEEI